jgi:acetyltransferase
MLYETPEELPVDVSPPKRPLMMILRAIAKENREVMREDEAKKFLNYYNFKVAPTFIVNNINDALADARRAGYPVTLELLAPQIPEDEKNNQPLNANSDSEVKESFEKMLSTAKNSIPSTQKILVAIRRNKKNGGTEIMLKGKADPVFGPVITFGMGGTNGTLLDDCSIGIPPLNATLIRRMMEQTKVYQLLNANKKIPQASLQLLEETVLLFSQLIIDFPQLKEVEINPLIVTDKEPYIENARITIDKESVFQKIEPHQHLIISPYPRKYETLWTLKNGHEVLLRPIKPEDEKLWLEMFQNFSEESIRYRFFQILKDTPHEVRVRYCNIDYDREMAIVAETTHEGKKKILGVSRISIEPNGKTGEMAFIIMDEWQGQGLGTKMVDYLLEIAKEMGVEEVYSIMLPDNQRALRLTQKMGFHIEYLPDGNVKGTLSLKEEIKGCKPQQAETEAKQPLKQEKPTPIIQQEETKQPEHREPEMTPA